MDLGNRGKYFQGAEDFFSGILGDQCIIFRDQGSTDTPGGLSYGFLFNCTTVSQAYRDSARVLLQL